MEINKELDGVFELLDGGCLSVAMEYLTTFGCKYPELGIEGLLEDIRSDYRRMADYWAGGYRDPQLDGIYAALTKRVYRLTADIALRYASTHSAYLTAVSRRVAATRRDWSLPAIRAALEGFVSDVALLGLEPEHTRMRRQTEIYTAHQQLMSDLFDYIWTSAQWSDGTAEAFGQILQAPTVDSNDQQLLVSAVMLSAMNIFDINKFRLLVSVYRGSADENVRQRALVGWVLAAGNGRGGVFGAEKREIVDGLLADSSVCGELTELQIQMLYCVSAESDTRTIQKEIMPDLLKHNNLSITRNGIEEREDDPMRDILDPEASERGMEKVEQSFRKMMDMQKAGSDIYFGGFSQMKRFPFFDIISNWFVPFYPEHPAVASLYTKEADCRLVRTIIGSGPFCNSDKYSFVLAFRQVMDKIPQNMREMMSNGEAVGIGMVDEADRNTPAYIRRIYLQDLYRFFRLYPSRGQFRNPFDYRADKNWDSGYIFFANGLFRSTPLEKSFAGIAAFMTKRKMYREAAEVLDNHGEEERDYQFYMLCGNVLLHSGNVIMGGHLDGMTAEGCFGRALELRPDDSKALVGYARSWFYAGNYGEACAAYGRLLEQNPDNRGFLLSYGVCLTNLERYDEAMKVLYRLDYEYPGDENVERVMARAMFGDGRYEQARKVYERMEEAGHMSDGDMVNRGYCEWFAGENRRAAGYFARALKARYPGSSPAYYRERCEVEIVDAERGFIGSHGITETEILLMVDLICDAALR